MGTGELASHPGGVAILLVASCYAKRDKLRLCGPLSLCRLHIVTAFTGSIMQVLRGKKELIIQCTLTN